uniref:Next to BRCA1 central domain-containing protein n=1 Tax=Trichobilharzia regenti TaxID=157069 RepID=A0AA85ILF0_TRIRE|nr:unnamed protein product [Trichobilharzia regenti]
MELRTFDIDAKLLEQFSALGTTDRDELIQQLKSVVGNDLTDESCRFFLELADWNLQRAIGAYFDFSFEDNHSTSCGHLTAYSASATVENTLDSADRREFDARIWPSPYDSSDVGELIKVTIENCGSCPWPEGTFLRSELDHTVAKLNSLSLDDGQVLWLPIGVDGKIPILPLQPSQIVDLTLNVTPPSVQINYLRPLVGALSFCLPNGERFGEILYCTAVPDVEHMTWRYQRGIGENNTSTGRISPMLLEDL